MSASGGGSRGLRGLRRVAGVLLVLAVAAGGAIAAAGGRDAAWTRLTGSPDTGPYAFERPARTVEPHDALACPAGACAEARAEIETPLFRVPAGSLYEAARRLVAAMPGAVFVAEDPARGRFRAVVRTPLIRFPDVVSVEARTEGLDASTLRVYSRSRIGHSDMGVNRRRVLALVDALAATLPAGEAAGGSRPPAVR